MDISSRRSKNVFTIFEKNPICASVEFAVCGNLFLIFVLEEINLKAAVYPTVLCLAFGLLFLLCGYLRYKKTGQKLEHLLQGEGPYEDSLPVAQDGIESGYQELIRKEEQQQRKEHARWEKSGQDMEDYYAIWVHQIKAPIAVMNVLLQRGRYRDESESESRTVPGGAVCGDGTWVCAS